ncbi:alpha/beta hydrolase [Virgibacillus kekensis]|uniref:Alpha/beta hydrolase n=1 Tax=Virgibacillus kekensis TaxID=202261 RepID=A0ABV9DFW1_9BACI
MSDSLNVMQDAEELFFSGNKTGVLVIHGFTGTTQSMRYLGERLAEEGYTVFGPRLTGHGTDPEDMEKASYKDWTRDVERGLEKLKEQCDDVFVTGLSMGGTLTLYLAEKQEGIKGIVPINAATHMPDLIQTYNELKDTDTRFVDGIGSDIKQEGVEELAYKKTPVRSMKEIIDLSEQVADDLIQIKTPALVVSSNVDHVVPPENSQVIYDSINSDDKDIVRLENSYHVATLDNDKELIADKCIEFIKEHQKESE